MNKPAFPRPGKLTGDPREDGMSLLKYYAGQADIPWNQAIESFEEASGKKEPTVGDVIEARAVLSFDYAEAMVKEAEKRRKSEVKKCLKK